MIYTLTSRSKFKYTVFYGKKFLQNFLFLWRNVVPVAIINYEESVIFSTADSNKIFQNQYYVAKKHLSCDCQERSVPGAMICLDMNLLIYIDSQCRSMMPVQNMTTRKLVISSFC